MFQATPEVRLESGRECEFPTGGSLATLVRVVGRKSMPPPQFERGVLDAGWLTSSTGRLPLRRHSGLETLLLIGWTRFVERPTMTELKYLDPAEAKRMFLAQREVGVAEKTH